MKAKLLLAACLVALGLQGFAVQTEAAVTGASATAEVSVSEEEDDPDYAKAHGQVDDSYFDNTGDYRVGSRNTVSTYTGGGYIHDTKFDNYTITNAIDVSKYQETIDWKAVKAAGIDYAFVRVGYRGLTSGALVEDENYATNLKNAAAAGLKVGVYIYSQATNTTEAVEEANFLISRIKSYDITLPVVIDYEYGDNHTGRLYAANLSATTATAICNTFAATVTAAGYTPMVYANKSMLESSLNAYDLNCMVWLANYTSQTTYTGDYTCWQYTSSGTVNGISGRVDCNFWYGGISGIRHLYNGYYNGVNYLPVFDPTVYAALNPDVAASCKTSEALLEHFVKYGMSEGRRASATFDVKSYRENYGDIQSLYGTNWKEYYMHYINYGYAEGRNGNASASRAITSYGGVDYSAVYNYSYYTKNNTDVANSYSSNDYYCLQHFVNSGMSEARQASENFNVKAYWAHNADLRAVYGKDWTKYYLHYIQYGRNEKRTATGSTTLTDGATVYNGTDYAAVYDYNYYAENNPDVYAAFGEDDFKTLEHFVLFGMKEGRQASKDFNAKAYRAAYADLRSVFGSDLTKYYLHYIEYGRKEGRTATGSTDITNGITVYNGVDYSAVYDYNYYRNANGDVAAVFGDNDAATLEHFVNYGMMEGRQASESFNVKAYRAAYADLRSAFGNDMAKYYLHYIQYGKAEGRTGTGSTTITNGITVYNGIDYSAVYDYSYYKSANPDVAAAFGDNDAAVLEHFVTCGMSEGRSASGSFSLQVYRNRYPDLNAEYGDNLAGYYMHYVLYGKAEGRTAV